MRVVLIVAILVAVGYYTVPDYVHKGNVERLLDAHPSATRNAPIEYYWAETLRLINHDESAIYHFRRIIKKYPDSAYAPLAWVDIIDIFDDRNDREGVFREAAAFMAEYPDHSKVGYVQKKINFLKYGL